MKFIISLLLSVSAYASPIQIHHEGNSIEANMFKDILVKDYLIPEDLIVIKQTKGCELLSGRGKFELCLKNNGDLLVVSVDRDFVNESLKIFRAP